MLGSIQNRIATRLFVGTIVAAGGTALVSSLYSLYSDPIPHEWMFLAALTLLSFFLAVKVPGVPVKISVSETFVFANVLLFGTAAATVTVALDALIISGWQYRRDPLKVLFNTTEPTLSIWLASSFFFLIVGQPLHMGPRDPTALLFPVLVLSLTYFVLNTSFTAVAIRLQSGHQALATLRGHFLWIALNYLGGASAALLIAQNSTSLDATTLSIILPLLIITYLTFKSSMGRIDDANRHVEQLNRLYMSTIRTLAMAVDAKDQTTHGHIRRVQTHAIALAKTLGIHDASLINAIEAAALLHDIGKLGVPEHILNKPGKLNSAEFEQMKLHAALGADILSATDFPYPVVPIVRHHHENWDGTGYPDGLSGMDIPIGARLLAVVDCFDALTSDRPYRQSMTQAEALTILTQRRGRMYDPLIVDTFIRFMHDIVRPEEFELRDSLRTELDGNTPRTVPHEHTSHLGTLSTSALEIRQMNLAGRLESSIPESVFIVFQSQSATKELVPLHASRELADVVTKIRIPFAQQLSGWVAANRETVANSDSHLDLREESKHLSLKKALCTPIASGTILFGVLAIYRKSDQLFTNEEIERAESLGRAISTRLATHISHSPETFRTEDSTLRSH
jgi:putative nucleotidyltransferase with HDIG domain